MPVGGAILGSAVIGGVASTVGANKAAKASQSATDATLQAQREALATQQANTDVARGEGDKALTQIGDRLGLNSGPAPQAGQPNWKAYIEAHPDLAQAIQSNSFNGSTPEEQAADHYARYGKDAGWQLPTYSAEEATAAAPKTDVQLTPAAQVQTYTRPTDQVAPAAYAPTNYTAPTFTRQEYAPKLDVSLGAFESSPEALVADNAFKTIANGSNAAFSATGGLQSGAAMKALADRAQSNALNYYGQFAGRTSNQFNTDRNRYDQNYNFDTNLTSDNALAYGQLGQQDRQYGDQAGRSTYQYGQGRADQNFATDRAYGTDLALGERTYQTGRYDTTTNNLFNLANIGQGAAAQTNTAVQNGVNTTSNALFSNAANQGNAALTTANQIGNVLNTGVNALAYYNAKRAPAATRGTYGPSA